MEIMEASIEETSGTHLQGEIRTTYADLLEVFGKPDLFTPYEYDKITCEWDIKINGLVVTIYDWKEDATPLALYDWHIGGHSKEAVDLVKQAMKKVDLERGTTCPECEHVLHEGATECPTCTASDHLDDN